MRNGLLGFLALAIVAFALPIAPALSQEAEAPVDPEVEQTSKLVDEVIGAVEKMRGLEFKEEISRKVFAPDDIRKLTMEMMERDMPPEKMRQMTAVYSALGFFPPDMDIAESLSELMAEGAAGFYDPETKTLYVLRGFSSDGAKPVIFHELIHALEDQYFDLGKLLKETLDATDKAMAIRAVVEGSATIYMFEYVKSDRALLQAMMRDMVKQMQSQMKVMGEIPVFLSVMMGIFPYTAGMAFVQATTAGDAEKIAGLYELMPASSEQILHREKYGPEGDYPTRIRMPDFESVLPEGFKKIHEDLIGELGVAILLNEYSGGTNSEKLERITALGMAGMSIRGGVKKASEGWDGDVVRGYEGPGGAVGLVWASRWDTEEDAKEFAAAYGKGLMYKWKSLGLAPRVSKIEIKGDRVMIVEGFPEDFTEKILTHAWTGTSFKADPRDPADVKALTGE